MRTLSPLVASLLLVTAATPALAYIGPGAGITVLGALWAVVLAVLLAVGAVVSYPIRAMMRRRRRSAATSPEREGAAGDAAR